MFTLEHFLWMGLCAVLIAGLTLVSIRKKLSLHGAGCIMTGICLLSELSKILSNMLPSEGGGMHLDPGCLPFHLCSLMIFVVLYLTFGKAGGLRLLLMNFLAVAGLLGSVSAILIPTNGTDFSSLPAYQCFVYHAGLLWFALYLILSGQAQLGTLGSLAKNLALMLGLCVGMLYGNSALSTYDTNFFYLTRPPMENLPYLNLDQGWYVYFLRLLILGAGLVALLHLPFLLLHRKKAPEA